MIRPAVLVAVLLACGTSFSSAGESRASIVPAGAKLEQLWNDGEFTEGVAVGPDGALYFSDIVRDEKPGKVMKYDPRTGKTTVYCKNSGKSNGLMFDRNGRLLAACGANYGKQALCEIKGDRVTVLVGKFHGKKFNSPNDLVVTPSGVIYFTDPRYIGPEKIELDHMSVYRYDPQTKKVTIATSDIEKPNGIVVSPDGKTMYVAETNNGTTHIEPGKTSKPGRMTLNAFAVRKDGTLGDKKVLANFGKETGVDGMTVDTKGNVYAAVRAASKHGVAIINPKGKVLGFIPTAELPTNCCFGRGKEIGMLYVTSGAGLYRIKLNAEGYHPAAAD